MLLCRSRARSSTARPSSSLASSRMPLSHLALFKVKSIEIPVVGRAGSAAQSTIVTCGTVTERGNRNHLEIVNTHGNMFVQVWKTRNLRHTTGTDSATLGPLHKADTLPLDITPQLSRRLMVVFSWCRFSVEVQNSPETFRRSQSACTRSL